MTSIVGYLKIDRATGAAEFTTKNPGTVDGYDVVRLADADESPVAIVKENPHCPEGKSDEISEYLPVGTKLYAAPTSPVNRDAEILNWIEECRAGARGYIEFEIGDLPLRDAIIEQLDASKGTT